MESQKNAEIENLKKEVESATQGIQEETDELRRVTSYYTSNFKDFTSVFNQNTMP